MVNVVGRTGRASISYRFFARWIGILEQVAKTYPRDAIYIFGHGNAKEKMVGLENLPGFADFHVPVGPQNRLPMNLSVADDELTQKAG